MLLAQLSASFQSLPPLPTSKLGPSCTDSQVGGFVCGLGPCGWSPMNCPVRLGVSSATITPTGFFSQGFWGFISPHWNSGLYCLCRSQIVPLGSSPCKCGTACSHKDLRTPIKLPPCCESSPPRLLVSASPTGLGEYFFFNSLVVRLPYSSTFWKFWLIFVFKFVVVLLLVLWGGTVYLCMPPSWPEV